MGQGKIIGVSCQNLAHALKAQAQGADYIGFGSVFETQTKPGRKAMDLDLLQKVIKTSKDSRISHWRDQPGEYRAINSIGSKKGGGLPGYFIGAKCGSGG